MFDIVLVEPEIPPNTGNVIRLAANTGCRLSGEDVRHLFERFWRGDAARTHTGVHCGLGLALVQRAVESLGGTVTASVADGTFTIRAALPAAPRATTSLSCPRFQPGPP